MYSIFNHFFTLKASTILHVAYTMKAQIYFFQPEDTIFVLVTFPEEKWSKIRNIKEGDFIELHARYRGVPRQDKENILAIQLDAINE